MNPRLVIQVAYSMAARTHLCRFPLSSAGYRAGGIRWFELLRGMFRNNGDPYSFIKLAAIRQVERHPRRLRTLDERIREIYGPGT